MQGGLGFRVSGASIISEIKGLWGFRGFKNFRDYL